MSQIGIFNVDLQLSEENLLIKILLNYKKFQNYYQLSKLQVYKPYSHVPRQENFAQLKFCLKAWAQLFESRLALTWGLILTRLLYLFIKSALSDNFLYSF